MGEINGNFEAKVHGPDDLLIGDNEFKSEVISLAAGEKAADGYVLTRNETSGKLELASDVEGQCFVLVNRDILDNTNGSAAKDFYARVCISGRVKKSAVTLKGNPLSDAQADALRSSSILALDVTNVGKTDNL